MSRFIARFFKYNPVILVYHSIDYLKNNLRKTFTTDSSLGDFNTEPEVFKQHIRFLKENFNIVSLNNLINPEYHRQKIVNPVSITFDDGYKSVFEYACPILKEENIPSCIFVSSDLVDQKRLPASLRLNFFYNKYGAEFLIRKAKVLLPELYNKLKNKEKKQIYSSLIYFLKYRNDKETTDNYFAELFKESQISEESLIKDAGLYMSWDNLSSLDKNLFTVGNHGKSHYRLSILSEEGATEEITEPLKKIKEVSGMEKPFYAVSYGNKADLNDFAKKLVLRDHSCLFMAYGGINPEVLKLTSIRRIPVPGIRNADKLFDLIYNYRLFFMV